MRILKLFCVGFVAFASCLGAKKELANKQENILQTLDALNILPSDFFGEIENKGENTFIWVYNNRINTNQVYDKGTDLKLCFIDSIGSVNWGITLEKQKFIPQKIYCTQDTSFVIIGSYSNLGSTNYTIILQKISKKGALLWENEYPIVKKDYDDVSYSILMKNGQLHWCVTYGSNCVVRIVNEMNGKTINEKSIDFFNEKIAHSTLHKLASGPYQITLSFYDTSLLLGENESKYYFSSVLIGDDLNVVSRTTNTHLNHTAVIDCFQNKNANGYFLVGNNIDGSEFQKLEVLYFDNTTNKKWRLTNTEISTFLKQKVLSVDVIKSNVDGENNLIAIGGIMLDDESYMPHTAYIKISPLGKVLSVKIYNLSKSGYDLGVLFFERPNKRNKLLSYISTNDSDFYKYIDAE